MTDRNLIRLNLPNSRNTLDLLLACIDAVLQRVDGIPNRPELMRDSRATFAQTLGEPEYRQQPRISAILDLQPRGLVVDLDGWQHTISLPAALISPILLPTEGPPGRESPIPEEEKASGLGMGLYLVKQVMDEVRYMPLSGDNRWHLVKNLTVTTPDKNKLSPFGPTPWKTETVHLDLPVSYQHQNVLGAVIETIVRAIPGLEDVEDVAFRTQLAAQEVSTNIIDHSYDGQAGRIHMSVAYDHVQHRLVIDSRDQGRNTFSMADIQDPFFTAQSAVAGAGFLSGSLLLLISMTIVNGGNYLFNLILGRWLGPAAFAEVSLIVTLMLVITLITATLQTVSAKFAAIHAADEDMQAMSTLRRWLGQWSWVVGLGFSVLLAVSSPWLARFFQMSSPWPFVILAAGLPLYFAQGVDRGILQGQIRFGALSASYQAEMWVRLAAGIGLVLMGFAVNGAVAGLTLSFIGTWIVALQARKGLPKALPIGDKERRAVLLFAWPVGMALVGQILINNSDILIVKRFFEPEVAGHYAALALIGRIVFFATWSVVTALFPIVAQRHQRGEPHRPLLFVSLGLVLGVSGAIILASVFLPELIVGVLFGEAYLVVAPLLWLYAVATAFYALSNVVINYRLSIGNNEGSYVAVVGGIAQVLGVWLFHDSLAQVVMVQIYVMGSMTAVLLLWDLWLAWRQRNAAALQTQMSSQ